MLNQLDLFLTRSIYRLFDDTVISSTPQLLGLIPYEFYVIPGMYLAILQVLWLGSPDPVQFHLLPHWFAYSIFQFLKKTIKRKRPGCFHKDLNKFIDSSHCKKGHEYQSFPSGHSGVAFSLATALFMEMRYSKFPKFFEIPIQKEITKIIISSLGLFVATMIAVHRISKGYHSFFDAMIGGFIGACIGFVSWTTLEFYKKKYQDVCEKNEEDKDCDNHKNAKQGNEFSYWIKEYHMFKTKISNDPSLENAIGISRILLSLPILYLLWKFLSKDVFHLASIKH